MKHTIIILLTLTLLGDGIKKETIGSGPGGARPTADRLQTIKNK